MTTSLRTRLLPVALPLATAALTLSLGACRKSEPVATAAAPGAAPA